MWVLEKGYFFLVWVESQEFGTEMGIGVELLDSHVQRCAHNRALTLSTAVVCNFLYYFGTMSKATPSEMEGSFLGSVKCRCWDAKL